MNEETKEIKESKGKKVWEFTKVILASAVGGAAVVTCGKIIKPMVPPPSNAVEQVVFKVGTTGISSLVGSKVSEDTLETLNSVETIVRIKVANNKNKKLALAEKKRGNDVEEA